MERSRRGNLENNVKSNPRILIVDDDPVTRLVLRRILANEPEWEVVEADNGVRALRLLEQGKPVDLCVTDINMPEMDGVGLVTKIRASDSLKHLRVILCTAVRDRETIGRVAPLGVDFYLVKPFKKELVLE